MARRPTWWFVRTRPPGATNDPEAVPNLIAARCRRVSQVAGGSKPDGLLSASLGGVRAGPSTHRPLPQPDLQRLGDVRRRQSAGSPEIRDRARDLEDSVVGPG